MRFLVRDRLLGIGDDYWIEDEHGRKAFLVDGKAMRLRDTFELKDTQGQVLIDIRQKMFALRDTMVDRTGRRAAGHRPPQTPVPAAQPLPGLPGGRHRTRRQRQDPRPGVRHRVRRRTPGPHLPPLAAGPGDLRPRRRTGRRGPGAADRRGGVRDPPGGEGDGTTDGRATPSTETGRPAEPDGDAPAGLSGAVAPVPARRSFSAGNCSRVVATFAGSNSTVRTSSPGPASASTSPHGSTTIEVTGLRNSRVRTGRSTGEDVRLVLDGPRLRQQRPVRRAAAPATPPRRRASRRPRRRARGRARGSGGRSRWRCRRSSRAGGRVTSSVARAHQHGLALVEAEAVDLAVGGGQVTGGGEDEGGVVEGAVRVAFGDRARVQPHARVARRLGHRLVRRPVQRLGLGREGTRTRRRRSVHSSGRTTRSAPAWSRTSEATRRRRDSTDSSSSTPIWMSEARTLPPSWHSSRPHGPTIVTRKHCRGASQQRNLTFEHPLTAADAHSPPSRRRHCRHPHPTHRPHRSTDRPRGPVP